jgi:site-specific DNA-methyltransferase (cytosine-N4-specific)
VLGDSIERLASYRADSVDLIMTSPPFGLVRKKDYGNVDADDYLVLLCYKQNILW